MSRVVLNEYNTSQIVYNVQNIVRANQGIIPEYPYNTGPNVADELYNLIFPLETEQAIRELLPNWKTNNLQQICVGVANTYRDSDDMPDYDDYDDYGDIEFSKHNSRAMNAVLSTPRMYMPAGMVTIGNLPGIKAIHWNGNNAVIYPDGDGSLIQTPALKAYVQDILRIKKERKEAHDAVKTAGEHMKAFLAEHSTLNKAAEEFGESIWMYVPPEMKALHDKVPAKKMKKEPGAPIEFDLEALKAHAVQNRLQIH